MLPAFLHIRVSLGCKLVYFDNVWYLQFLPVLVQYREGNFPGDSKKITYTELLLEVCKFANVLKDKGKSSGIFFSKK